ncbi:MAG: NUDIX hydrolase [Myxococcales bacterium]|nr:NUDIX hydrolase [Myxococcales bacterium]
MSDAQEIRPAATVVLLRERSAGMEVLLLRRNSKLVFYGGAWVFPGGRIDAADHGGDGDDQAARRAGVRELQEEAGLTLPPEALVHFAQWITPPGRPRRFDTWYFAAVAPGGSVRVDDGEVDAHRWMRPADALDARAAGRIELPPPTFVTLTTLREHERAGTALAALAATRPTHFEPRPLPIEGGTLYLYAGDAGYAERRPETPGARHRMTAVEDGWHYVREGS